MAKKRQRRRTKSRPEKQNVGQTVVITGQLVPAMPAMQRPGLDAAIIIAIQAVDALVKDMRNGLLYPSAPDNEDSAVKRYLLYISMLVDIVLPDIVMSAIASHDHMVEMKQRILLEYTAKAAYFDDHPDYALYMMTINEAEQVLRKLTKGDSDANAIATATKHLHNMKTKFANVADKTQLSFGAIFAEYAGKDDYIWLYGAPSALLHGDPEGMRVLLEQRADGTQIPHQTLPMDELNAMLVDTGRNALLFCDKFISRFRADDEPLQKRVRALNRSFIDLMLKYSMGRDDVATALIKQQAEDFDAETGAA